MTTQICLGLFRAQLPAPPLPNPCGGAIYFGLVVTQGGPLVSQSLEWLLGIAACFCLTHPREWRVTVICPSRHRQWLRITKA
jgi:hypothetical protein